MDVTMQQYTVLGITLQDYGVREALRNTDSFLHTGALNTVTYISGAMLAQASREEELARCVEQFDMTMCAKPDVLEAAGLAGRSRLREIDEQVYLRELLKKLFRNRNGIYLLAETVEMLETFRNGLSSWQENLYIRGSGAWEDFEGRPERLVNALNDLVPDVVISRMPWMQEFRLLKEYGRYVNAELWVSLPWETVSLERKPPALERLKRRFDYRLFTRRVKAYNDSIKTDEDTKE